MSLLMTGEREICIYFYEMPVKTTMYLPAYTKPTSADVLEILLLLHVVEVLHTLETSLSLRTLVKIVVDVCQNGCKRWKMSSSCLGSIVDHVKCAARQKDLRLHLFDIRIHSFVLPCHYWCIVTPQA